MANYRHGATYGSLAYDLDALAREKQLDEAGKLPQKKKVTNRSRNARLFFSSSIETLLSKTQQSFSGSALAGRMGPPPEYFSAGSRPTGPPKGRNGPAPLGRRPV